MSVPQIARRVALKADLGWVVMLGWFAVQYRFHSPWVRLGALLAFFAAGALLSLYTRKVRRREGCPASTWYDWALYVLVVAACAFSIVSVW